MIRQLCPDVPRITIATLAAVFILVSGQAWMQLLAVALGGVQEADFAITSGQTLIKAFESSPGEHRHFCSECGSPIYGQAQIRKGQVSVRCGGLDDDPLLRPMAHIYSASKAPWVEIRDHLPQFAEAQDR